jgi:uncharacterized protein
VTPALRRLEAVLAGIMPRIVACSGGVDSLLLATVAHRADPEATTVAHAVTPAVPGRATGRVLAMAADEGWALELLTTAEFDDERYLRNPTDRCYYCKSHLYDAMVRLAGRVQDRPGWQLASGANADDLGEYRPGLLAASERGVRHPLVEAHLSKEDVRNLARQLSLDFAELPAAPCLASRLYTGTRVTEARVRAVDAGEEVLRQRLGIGVVRCRLRSDEVLVEVRGADRAMVTPAVLAQVAAAMRAVEPGISRVRLDDRPYRPGRAIIPMRSEPASR